MIRFALKAEDGRLLEFDEGEYLRANPDVGRIIGQKGFLSGRYGFPQEVSRLFRRPGVFQSGWDHYIRTGFIERRAGVPCGMEEAVRRMTGKVSAEPLPPVGMKSVMRVNGYSSLEVHDYVGRVAAFNVYSAMMVRAKPGDKVLDFGCGCGRVVRYLKGFCGGVGFHGTDIDEEAVSWCRGNLSHLAEFSCNGFDPPLGFEDESFDFVYVVSVFTHMTEEMQFRWLEELRRVTRRGGRLLMSTHGDSWCPKSAKKGFLSLGSGTKEDVMDSRQVTYHAGAYVREHWGRMFEVEGIEPRGLNWAHDLVVCRRA